MTDGMIELVPMDGTSTLEKAISVVQDGGLIIFPTDTVYGLGCAAFNQSSIQRLFDAKGRDASKAIAILLAEIDQMGDVAINIPEYAGKLAHHFLPGPLTLVLPRHPELPGNLSPLPTIGVRLPDHPFVRDLIRTCGPMAVTSANLSGAPNSLDAITAARQLGNKVDMIIDGGTISGGTPSTVVDCTGNTPIFLRIGPIPEAEIWDFLKKQSNLSINLP